MYTDHSAVHAILDAQHPSGKHAHWWTKVYGWGVKEVKIKYRPGKTNGNADALSRCPHAPPPGVGVAEDEYQVAQIDGDAVVGEVTGGDGVVDEVSIGQLLCAEPGPTQPRCFGEEQRKDLGLLEMFRFLEEGVLPADVDRARKLTLLDSSYTIVNAVLYHLDTKSDHFKQVVFPNHLRRQIMEEAHQGPMAAHFSGRLFQTLRRRWWLSGMYSDAKKFVRGCPDYAVVSGGGRVSRPPLNPIPVSRPFQIIGVDVMDLPITSQGNKHVVFQNLFTKWPMVYAVPDQRSEYIVKILVDEVIPFCGIPEALLSDRRTSLLTSRM